VSSIRRESGIGISRAPGIGVLCHRKCRNSDGRLYGYSHMVSGHMDHGTVKGASQCKGASKSPGGLVRHDVERRQTPTRIKTVVLYTLWSY
jgi:hypothetical protein